MRIITVILEAVFPFRKKIIFRAFQGGSQFLIALLMASFGWSFGNYIFRAFTFSLFDGWEKFLPQYTESISSEVLLQWFSWYGLDAAGKFLGMWFFFNHANFHMYNYLYLVRLKGMHRRKYSHIISEYPQLIEWAYTPLDAIYVATYLVLDFLLPFVVMLFSMYIASSIGSRVALVPWVQWGGALVLPFLSLSMYSFSQSLVRAAFHYQRLEQEVGENFDPSSW